MTGKLFIVATPIGNLKDITFRAVETLKEADLIACEDTRHTKKLLSHYGITVSVTSYFEHNKIKKGEYLTGLLKEGKNIALVSDSGTPGISDPGYNIINTAIKNNIPVTIIPGPCAFVSALVISGLPTDSFIFHGFLSNKKAKRQRQLEQFRDEKKTMIFYESPHRLLMMLKDMYDVIGNREISVIRELTKIFEESLRLKIDEAIEYFTQKPPRGEFILVVRGKTAI
jgi:16S rRNA (cytidine1402-2'-O)-methyltransferase